MEDLYSEALLRWAPVAAAAMLPTLDIAATTLIAANEPELPPDPQAVLSVQPYWDELMAAIVLPGVAALWTGAAMAAAAAKTLGIAVDLTADMLASSKDQFLVSYGLIGAKVPSMVRDKAVSLLANASQTLPTTGQRALLREAVTPGSAMLREMARGLGYHGASILNDALMTVAGYGHANRKFWLSRRDTRVRETHRIADGQIAPLDGSFMVGGAELSFPGDPRGPIGQIANCRCVLLVLAPGEHDPAPWVSEHESMAASAAGEENTMTSPIQIDSVETQEPETFRTFTDATIAFIGVPTSDNRMFSKDVAFEVRTPPLPLMWMRNTGEGGHMNAYSVGIIESARVDDDKVLASGYLLNTPEADEAVEQLRHGITRPSVDLGRHQWKITDKDGAELTEDDWWDLPLDARVFTTFVEAELIGMTLVATPAFGDTKVTLNEERETRDLGLVASAVAHVSPRVYPAKHFSDPHLLEPTLPTIAEDGRIFGHIACWGQCHRSIQTHCELAPHNFNDYAAFHTSPPVHLDDDTRIPVGRLTVGIGHASPMLSGIAAQAHYDDTKSCWALVRVGEDDHGIWFSGVAAPWASAATIEAGLASPLSGDWRDFGQGLELVAALSVNTPGFVARGRQDEQGRPATLVAALGPHPQSGRRELTRDMIKAAVKEAMIEQDLAAQRAMALARANELVPMKTLDEQIEDLMAKAGP